MSGLVTELGGSVVRLRPARARTPERRPSAGAGGARPPLVAGERSPRGTAVADGGIHRAPAAPAARPATDHSSGLRLTRRGRLVVAVLASLVAMFGVFASQRAVAGEPGDAVAVTARTVVSGETLWDIAGSQAAPGQDVREVVDALVELNALTGSDLRAGQELLVPAP